MNGSDIMGILKQEFIFRIPVIENKRFSFPASE